MANPESMHDKLENNIKDGKTRYGKVPEAETAPVCTTGSANKKDNVQCSDDADKETKLSVGS